MTRDEFANVLDRIALYYPDFILANKDDRWNERVDLWYEQLGSCMYELMIIAIDEYVKENKRPPHICDLREWADKVYHRDIMRWQRV